MQSNKLNVGEDMRTNGGCDSLQFLGVFAGFRSTEKCSDSVLHPLISHKLMFRTQVADVHGVLVLMKLRALAL